MTDTTQSSRARVQRENGFSHGLLTRSLLELVGTFFVVMVLLSASSWDRISDSSLILPVLAAFVAYAAAAYLTAPVTGGHLNPAVSLTAALTGRLKWLDFVAYCVAQTLGGILAAFTMKPLFNFMVSTYNLKAGAQSKLETKTMWELAANRYAEVQTRLGGTMEAAIIVELVATLLITAVAVSALKRNGLPRRNYAVATGLAYAAGTVMTSMITNSALNPARATGSAILAKIDGDGEALTELWIFWIVPLLAAAVVGLIVVLAENMKLSDDSSASSDKAQASDAKASDEKDKKDSDDSASEGAQQVSDSEDSRDIADFNKVMRQDTEEVSPEQAAASQAAEMAESTNIDYSESHGEDAEESE